MRPMFHEARVRLRHLDWLDCLAIAIFLIGVMRPAFGQIAYNARTDVTPQAYPGTIPCPGPSCASSLGTLTGAGYQLTPTDFPTTPYIRITDNSTPSTNHLGFTTACSASSEVNLFGAKDDYFWVCQLGGFNALYAFNPATNVATYVAHSNTMGSTPAASYVGRYITYAAKPCPASTSGCSQYDLVIWQYDLTGLTAIPTPTVVSDLTTACPLTSYSGAAFIADLTTSLDDQTFTTAVCTSGTCGQDQAGAIYVVKWNRTNGCSYFDTSAWKVYNNGVLLGSATNNPGSGFTIHNARGSLDGTDVRITPTGNPGAFYYVWTAFGLTVNGASSGNSCGHTCNGTLNVYSKCQNTYDNGLFEAPFTSINSPVSLPQSYPSPDQGNSAHLTCADGNATDTNPFFAVMALTNSSYPTYAWDNEYIGQATDGSGKTWRLGHTYATVALENLLPGAISQDGKYLLGQTDWMDMLGCTNGTSVGCGVLEPDWITSTAYTTTSRITPLTGNTGGYSYQPSGSCTSGGSEPNPWNQTIGLTSTDGGGCVFTNIGAARTDVVMLLLPTVPNMVNPYGIWYMASSTDKVIPLHSGGFNR